MRTVDPEACSSETVHVDEDGMQGPLCVEHSLWSWNKLQKEGSCVCRAAPLSLWAFTTHGHHKGMFGNKYAHYLRVNQCFFRQKTKYANHCLFFFHFSALTQSRKSLIVSNILSLKKCYSAFTLCWSFCHTSRCCFEMSFLRFRRLGAFSCLLWHCPDVCDSTLPVS